MKIDDDIAALDLDPIAYKLHLDEGWDLSRIDGSIGDYRVFLQALRNAGGQLVPTRLIDTVWHHHILDTEKYIEDCQRLFGRYVHHYPYSGLFGEEDAARQRDRFTRSLTVYDTIRQSKVQQETDERRI